MLTHLKLENFKIWRSTGAMRLAPITLLLGTNSSGKSSLIQSLLLIRQTVKGDDPNLDLNLGNPDAGDSITLGQFKDVLCRKAQATETVKANQFGIEFSWSADGESTHESSFTAIYGKGKTGSAELMSLRLGNAAKGFTVQRTKPNIYRLSLASEARPLGQSADYRPERSFAFPAAVINRLGERGGQIKEVGPTLLDELSRIIYLGPVRQLARRDYVWAGRIPAHIGDDGAKAIDALIASGVVYQVAKKNNRAVPADGELFEKAIDWLSQFKLADGLEVRALGQSARYELLIKNHDQCSNIKDVGVGVSQVLPVIVAALFAKPGHIVIVEEPESHLHPLAQSKLAELLAQVSKARNVQFIVETHSEHLFRRMQTLMAKEELTPQNAAMYFVEREGNTAKLRTLELDDFGRVKNWPEGFFGDALGETREQARLMFTRQQED